MGTAGQLVITAASRQCILHMLFDYNYMTDLSASHIKYQYTFSTHPSNISSQHNLSTHSLNPLSTLLTQSTLSTHPITPPINPSSIGIREDTVPIVRPKEKDGLGYAPFAPARGHWGNDRCMGDAVTYCFTYYDILCCESLCDRPFSHTLSYTLSHILS